MHEGICLCKQPLAVSKHFAHPVATRPQTSEVDSGGSSAAAYVASVFSSSLWPMSPTGGDV